jgi:hypothetical protein
VFRIDLGSQKAKILSEKSMLHESIFAVPSLQKIASALGAHENSSQPIKVKSVTALCLAARRNSGFSVSG